MKKNYKNKIVLITGAGHGIGYSLAKIYDDLGAKTVILDINQENLNKVQKEFKNAHTFLCDVTNKENVYEVGQKILTTIGTPYIIVNNAGVVENSDFLNCDDELLERTMNVNIVSHFWVLKAFLPSMVKKKEGHVCEIASAAGLMGVSGLTAYCASKHAVVGFSQALRYELKKLSRGKIKITTICPSFINTGMFKGVKPALFTPLLDQEKIAQAIFEAVDRDKEKVLLPFMVKMLPLLSLLPSKAFDAIAKVFKVNQAMDDIIEKKNYT